MKLKSALPLSACALACLASASATAKTPTPSYYVSLGDSLARGAQPNAAGATVPTNQGYADFLYATEKSKVKGLKLIKLGCLGESTTTIINGGICSYARGSQLRTALKFIVTHKIALVTLDIGANDVDFCAKGNAVNLPCITKGVRTITTNVPKIVRALRAAAGPRVEIAGMTYYDPFLANFLTGQTGQQVAQLSVSLADGVNRTLTAAFRAQRLRVADLGAAFKTDAPFSQTATLPGVGMVPAAVASICTLTWMCAPPPQGPNIHANATGYKSIARAFAAAL
jgi:lysophospholipase L1-like esterase